MSEKSDDLMPPFHDGCKCVYNPETNDFETPGGDEYACSLCMSMRGIRNFKKEKENSDLEEWTNIIMNRKD